MRALHALYLFAALSACSASARADGLYDTGASTWLDLGTYHTDLDYAGATHAAHVGRYGIGYSEPVAEDTSFALQGGYVTLDVDGEPPAAFLDYSGRYLGLMGRYEGTWGDYFNLAGEVSYTWHDVTSSGFTVTHSEITWYETWA